MDVCYWFVNIEYILLCVCNIYVNISILELYNNNIDWFAGKWQSKKNILHRVRRRKLIRKRVLKGSLKSTTKLRVSKSNLLLNNVTSSTAGMISTHTAGIQETNDTEIKRDTIDMDNGWNSDSGSDIDNFSWAKNAKKNPVNICL